MDTETLQKINQYRPLNSPDLSDGEVATFDIFASNNLLHSSLFKWDVQSLKRMAETYKGKPLIFDHDWDNVSSQVAFIYDTVLLYYPKPSQEIQDYFLSISPNPAIDKEILATEGLYQVICSIATELSHPITNELSYGRKINASIGGLADGSMICPICQTDFEDDDCPHLIPVDLPDAFRGTAPIAPYWIRAGFKQTLELSLVMSGNCPGAKVINNQLAELMHLAPKT